MSEFTNLWVYLSASPLFHLTLTLIAFQIGLFIYKKAGMTPLLNPVLSGDHHRRGGAGFVRHVLSELFRWGEIRAFPARSSHCRPCHPALSSV